MKKHLNLYIPETSIYLLKRQALEEGISVSDLVLKMYDNYKKQYPKDENAGNRSYR